MTAKKVNWAQADKRIRDRRKDWTNAELEQLDKELLKLPDLSDKVDTLSIPQPALAQPGGDDEAN